LNSVRGGEGEKGERNDQTGGRGICDGKILFFLTVGKGSRKGRSENVERELTRCLPKMATLRGNRARGAAKKESSQGGLGEAMKRAPDKRGGGREQERKIKRKN